MTGVGTVLDATVRPLRELASEPWSTPQQIRQELLAIPAARRFVDEGGVLDVSGHGRGLALVAMRGPEAAIECPAGLAQCQDLITSLAGTVLWSRGTRVAMRVGVDTGALHRPRVLLINPCEIGNFPVPRLSLSIGYLASFLRQRRSAEVHLIDMQMDVALSTVIEEACAIKPDIVGISISFGQLNVAREIFRRLSPRLPNAKFVLGNVISAFGKQYLWKDFPGAIICVEQGEETLDALCKWVAGKKRLHEVPGIAYLDGGRLRMTPRTAVNIEQLPPPALDTVPQLALLSGALTAEFSRGCQWGHCTFCPRDHKFAGWAGMTPIKMVEHIGVLHDAAIKSRIKPHIFFADEEFVGRLEGGGESARIKEFARLLQASSYKVSWDTEARVDQVYDPKRSEDWHVDRLEMWNLCRQAGLDRLFLGVESGADAQLKRYGKGSTAEQNLVAIRLLSGLGIPLRFGFITFDPLMEGWTDLKDNLRFLGRTDGFLRKTEATPKDLFRAVTTDPDFVRKVATRKPLFAGVSYMGATLEVLLGSPYFEMVSDIQKKRNRKLLRSRKPDLGMGRWSVRYIDSGVQLMAKTSQLWIDRNFSLAYTLKSLHKTAAEVERPELMERMVRLRELHFYLLNGMVGILDADGADFASSARRFLEGVSATARAEFDRSLTAGDSERKMATLLGAFQTAAHELVRSTEAALDTSKITDNARQSLRQAIEGWQSRWDVWELINGDVFGVDAPDEPAIV